MEKTNKSYTKRIRKTKNNKLLSRHIGQNHFRSKKSGVENMQKRKPISLNLMKKIKERFFSKN